MDVDFPTGADRWQKLPLEALNSAFTRPGGDMRSISSLRGGNVLDGGRNQGNARREKSHGHRHLQIAADL